MADLEDTIADVAENPKKLKGDSGEVEEHSLGDLINADRHLASKDNQKNGRLGVRFLKITAPGSTL